MGRIYSQPRGCQKVAQGNEALELFYPTIPNPPQDNLEPQLTEMIPLKRAMSAQPLP